MAIAPSLLWLFVGRLFSGALGATYPVAAASVADVTEPEERVKQFGVLNAMIGLGLILGPLLGGIAAGHGARAPFWRSKERRAGKAWISTCISRLLRDH